MILNKWDASEHRYRPYKVPDGWHVSVYETDMDTAVNCAQCGRAMRFGDGYTSQEIHTIPSGFGYTVCQECHEAEMGRRMGKEATA